MSEKSNFTGYCVIFIVHGVVKAEQIGSYEGGSESSVMGVITLLTLRIHAHIIYRFFLS